MTTLFTMKKDSEISKEMLDAFCGLGIKEAIRVDYKQDFPSDLAKTIAAFANTWGGLLLIGVTSDEENRPKVPIHGVPFAKGLEERIYQVCNASVYPPVMPDVWVVRFRDLECTPEERAVIVVRVEESEDKLHAVEGRTGIYFRTGNISSPFERADVEAIATLLRKRETAMERRTHLMRQAQERFDFFFGEHVESVGRDFPDGLRDAIKSQVARRPIISVHCVPALPRAPLGPMPSLIRHLGKSRCKRRQQYEISEFPAGRSWLATQDGALKQSASRIMEMVNVSEFGGVSFFADNPQDVYPLLQKRSDLSMQIDPIYVGRALLGVWALALTLYQNFAFYGTAQLVMRISGIQGYYILDSGGPKCSDNVFQYTVTTTATELGEQWTDLFRQFMQRLHWAFGYDYPRLEDFEREAEESWSLNFGAS